ncbi:MAG: vWA domain-containing protein [Arachnia sp.]
MRILMKLTIYICAISILAWIGYSVASANDAEDIAATMGIATLPADYVVVLDTSGSMTKDGAWTEAVDAVAGLASSLGAGDRLSVVTFDEFTEVAWQGVHPVDTQGLAAALPTVPEGERTDIGAGLAMALDVLEGPDARPLAAVVLMTDGQITTEPDSPYRAADGAAWADLAQRAGALEGDTAAFALGLAQGADAAAMQRVFPEADLVADGVEIVDYLSGLSQQVLLHRLAGILEPDAGTQLTVSWGRDAVTVTSPLAHVPLQVADLTLTGNAGTVAGTQPLILGPGESATLPVVLDAGFVGDTTLVGTVTSPWQATLAQLDFALPILEQTPLTLAAPVVPPVGSPATSMSTTPSPSDTAGVAEASGADLPPLNGTLAVAGGAAVVIVALLLLVMAARPRLRGTLTLAGPGHQHEMALTGSRMAIPLNPWGVRGHISATRGAPRLRIRGGTGAGGARVVGLGDGTGVDLGDATVTWQDERTLLESRLGLSPPD